MKVREVKINGKPGYCADLGKRDGKRRRLYFRTQKEAITALRDAQKESVAVGRRWTYLPPKQRASVVDVLAEIDAAGLTLRQVWDGYRNGPRVAVEKSLQDAISDLITAKRNANRRPSYIASLEQYLTRWSRGQEARPISAVTLDEVDRYLNSLASLSSRATGINRLSTLFSFAVRKGWRNDNPCERVERPHVENGTPDILSIEEVKKALSVSRAAMNHFLPWLTLALFAGIRPEEADQITWDHIDLNQGIVRIDAAVAKVRNRRTVHLKPAAIQWLKLGGNLPLTKVSRRRYIRKLRDALGWKEWKKDVLRHSAASYWMASDQDAPRVASELGTSVKVLMKNYRDGDVSDADAEEFWNLTPRRVAK